MADAYFLGIDLGTSGVKGLLLSEVGNVMSKSFAGYETLSEQPGYAEQKAEDWLTAVSMVCRQLLKKIPPAHLRGVGFSGQLNGFVLLDKYGKLIRTPIIWLDQRAEEEVNQLKKIFKDTLEQSSYNKVDNIAVLSKLFWMKNKQPELLEKAETILFVKDYVIYQLTGERSTDFSEASCTLLYDFNQPGWNDDVLNVVGIRKEMLPTISPSSQIIGHVTAQGEKKMNIPAGVPVVAGAGDVSCLTVGSGVYQSGNFGLTLGTGGHMVTVSPTLFKETIGQHWQMQHVTADEYVILGLIQNCGLAVNWWRKLLSLPFNHHADELSFDDLSALAKQSTSGANGVFFLPFLEGSAPPLPPIQSGGMFYGLSSTHSAADMTQAVFEGIAFNIRDCVGAYQKLGFRIEQIMVGEGGSRNKHWLQIISNILNVPLFCLQEIDASALGASLIALSGVNNMPLPDAMAVSVNQTPQESITPSSHGPVRIYEEKYQKYQELIATQTG